MIFKNGKWLSKKKREKHKGRKERKRRETNFYFDFLQKQKQKCQPSSPPPPILQTRSQHSNSIVRSPQTIAPSSSPSTSSRKSKSEGQLQPRNHSPFLTPNQPIRNVPAVSPPTLEWVDANTNNKRRDLDHNDESIDFPSESRVLEEVDDDSSGSYHRGTSLQNVNPGPPFLTLTNARYEKSNRVDSISPSLFLFLCFKPCIHFFPQFGTLQRRV